MNALIFPGHGAQYSGMGKELFESYPKARDVYENFGKILGMDIAGFCFSGKDKLKDIAIQQLAIAATSLVTYELFKEKGIKIDFFSGLSFGEYTCLYPAGVMDFENTVLLVKKRAEATKKAAEANPSQMLVVIGLTENELKNKDLYIANLNYPGQVVVSIRRKDKEKIKNSLEGLGARVIELEIAAGFHSPLMEPAKSIFRQGIKDLGFSDAQIPIVSNVTGKAHTDKYEIKNNLIEQLTSVARWQDCVEFMIKQGVNTFYEMGPSKILRGLIKKINSQVKIVSIEDKKDIEKLNKEMINEKV